MKKLITSLLTFCSIGLGFSQNWQDLTPNPKASFMDIAIVDSNNCYAVGYKGTVFKTVNGGNTWTPLTSGTSDDLTSICAIGGVVYSTAPKEGKVLRSSDGQTFTSTVLNGFNGNAVYFFNNQIGYVTGGQKGKIAKTTNGGDSWEIIQTNYQSGIKKVFFVSATNGFAIAHESVNNVPKCVILKTSDGGSNWTKVYEEQNVGLNDLSFADASYGTFVGNGGKLITTSDGGNSFTTFNTGVIFNLKAVSLSDSFVGYAVGINGTIFKTTNRGVSWSNISVAKKYPLEAIEFQGNVGYTLVSGNKILKSINSGL